MAKRPEPPSRIEIWDAICQYFTTQAMDHPEGRTSPLVFLKAKKSRPTSLLDSIRCFFPLALLSRPWLELTKELANTSNTPLRFCGAYYHSMDILHVGMKGKGYKKRDSSIVAHLMKLAIVCEATASCPSSCQKGALL